MSKAKSADLLMKLYELRREDKMRDARNWFMTFFPESAEDIMATILDPENSGKYRMVVSYWDMAASFVNHGAINEAMFNEVSGESVMVFSRIQPHLKQLREITKRPKMLANLEKLVMRLPDAEKMLATQREMMKKFVEAREERANNSQ